MPEKKGASAKDIPERSIGGAEDAGRGAKDIPERSIGEAEDAGRACGLQIAKQS